MSISFPQSPQVRQAVCIAVLMMAWQVAAKTARDSLFWAVFRPESLLAVVGAAAVCSILLAYGSSVVLRRIGPSRVIPFGFFLSATVHLVQWILLPVWQKPVTVFIYLYVVSFGPVLLTGFWALANECFDSREARRHFGQIGAFGTLGAIAGGLLAERVATLVSGPAILILMAVLQVLAGIGLLRFASSIPPTGQEESPSFPEIISTAPYLAGLAAFVLLTSMSAASLDYLYRAGAVVRFGQGQALVRFFSFFNAITSGLTFLLQAGLSPLWLRRFGPGGTVAALPVAVAGASVASVVLPGPISVILSRSLEQMLRGSLFRSGYELFYLPMPSAEKRAAKPVIDIGVDRMGEGLASGAIKLMLLTLPAERFAPVLLISSASLSAIAAWLAIRLDRSYVMVLERGLANQALHIELEDVQDALTRTVLLESATGTTFATGSGGPARIVGVELQGNDPVLFRLSGLRDSDARRVRKAIAETGKWEPVIVAQMIDLLARDDVAKSANEALRAYLPMASGQLADRLADTATDPKIRRRIPRLLASSSNPLAWDALFRQLSGGEFEIRYRCGRALAEVAERHPEFRPPTDAVFLAVQRELASHSIAAASGEAARQRMSHMANLLGLVLPPQSVHLAFRALQTSDAKLRATAIEYLDSVLPLGLRRQMAAQFDVPLKPASPIPVHSDVLKNLVAELGSDIRLPESQDD